MARLFKLLALVILLAISLLAAWAAKRLGKLPLRDRVSCWCHAGVLRLIGVRLKVSGQITAARPLLVVSNHLSYLDVHVLGSVFPFRFTPKKEIASWPGVAALCRVSDAIFVDRRPEKLPEAAADIENCLATGQVVCLFPEATTGNGIGLLPFKSSFFRLAETGVRGEKLAVQPIAVAYTRIHRLPIGSSQWPGIAWYGDMELLPHLWNLLKLGHITAELIFLPPVTIDDYQDRKAMAAHCQKAIAEAIEAAKYAIH